jgi:hypothetical protein
VKQPEVDASPSEGPFHITQRAASNAGIARMGPIRTSPGWLGENARDRSADGSRKSLSEAAKFVRLDSGLKNGRNCKVG